MQSQHAHMDMNHAAGYEPRVSSASKLEALASAALANVPGAKKLIEDHFGRGPMKDPHRLFPPRPRNQTLHLGW